MPRRSRGALEMRGHDVLVEPLLTILPIAGADPDLAGVQAILLTSANALPALGGADPGRPVFAVGEASARAARAAGCGDVRAAGGDAASLARLIIAQCRPADGALLHLAGTDVRPGLAEALRAAGFGISPPGGLPGGRRGRAVATDDRSPPRARDRCGTAVLAPQRRHLRGPDRRARSVGLPRPNRGNLPQRRGRGALPSPELGGSADRRPPRG